MSDGYGRGTKYRLRSNPTTTDIATYNANVDSLDANVDSSAGKTDGIVKEYNLSAEAQSLIRRKRLGPNDMEFLIGEVATEWRTIQELTDILGRDKTYLRNHVLPAMVSKGVLEREYPSILNHPNQRYRVKQS